jgi:hypothetical protein
LAKERHNRDNVVLSLSNKTFTYRYFFRQKDKNYRLMNDEGKFLNWDFQIINR